MFVIHDLIVCRPVTADDAPFIYSSNRGDTGLMEIPTARIMKKNSFRLGFSQSDPYRYYYGAISPLKGLEINGRITEVMGVKSIDEDWGDYGNFKDKSFGIKYQIIPEGKYMSALSIGVMDPHGTRIYPSEYIVASKQIFPFDFTVGYGNGRFGDEPLDSQDEGIKLDILDDPDKWLDDSNIFWGIQFAPSEKYAFMLEYSPVKYHKQTRDPAQPEYFSEKVPSEYNYGFMYSPVKWAQMTLSYQRGDTVGFNLTTVFDIGKPLIPIYDPPYREAPSEMLSPEAERLTNILYRSGFSDIGVEINGDRVSIQAQNQRYFYNTKAIKIMLVAVSGVLPEYTGTVRIILTENGVPLFEFVSLAEDIRELHAGRLTDEEFLYLSRVNVDISEVPYLKKRHKKRFSYGIQPVIETFFNDPSGFFKYRAGVKAWTGFTPWKGGEFLGGIATYPGNNISTANEPLSIPVRSDIALYKEENVTLDRLMLNQVYRLHGGIYSKLAAGWLETQYAGIDAEAALPLMGGRLLLGISGSAVKKRDPDSMLKLKDDPVKDNFTTAFFNARVNFPDNEISFDIKAGRFLAGDNGARFKVTKFINGVKIWAWYTVTDTSVFSDDMNKDYNDKVLGISIPLRLFSGADSKSTGSFSLSSWTRDTGQDIEHYMELFDFIGRDREIFFRKDWGNKVK